MLQAIPWVSFVALVLALLALDLGVFHRTPRAESARAALGWTAVWIAVSLVFNVLIFFIYENHWFGIGATVGHELSGRTAAFEFFTAYIVEKSLSLDNIFVIAMLFTYFRIPVEFQHRVLYWGILGALILRGVMIAAGLAFIERFSWMIYVFGGLLLFTAAKMLVVRHDTLEPEKNPLLALVRRFYPVTSKLDGQRFFTMENGKRAATPLFLTLVLVESTDVLFAVDSIPAVFSVTLDPFIVFTSNVFAILGLRSLYFALAAVMDKFRFLKISLVFILAFVGIKMILSHHSPIPALASLVVIGGILSVGILASIMAPTHDPIALRSPLNPHKDEDEDDKT